MVIFDPKTEDFRKFADFGSQKFKFDQNQVAEVSPGKVIALARIKTEQVSNSLIVEWRRTQESIKIIYEMNFD